MFKEVLKYMQKHGEFDTKIIARGLKLNEAIVEQCKETLIQKGYIIKEDSMCTTEACGSCSCDCSGKMLNEFSSWKFTEKAMKIINK